MWQCFKNHFTKDEDSIKTCIFLQVFLVSCIYQLSGLRCFLHFERVRQVASVADDRKHQP